MKISLVAVGKLKSGPERELANRYAERLAQTGRSIGLAGPVVVEIGESLARSAKERKTQEGRALLAAVEAEAGVIALDERGAAMSSEAFAAMLGAWRDAGRRGAACVIGGADGLSEDVRERADAMLCLGRMTLPHQLARVLLLEQLYRAATILAGHPYHRS